MTQALATDVPATRKPTASIVCCSGDICGQIGAENLPWAKLVVGIFVAAQTMMLGMTINLSAPEDPKTLLMLQSGMLVATLVVLALLGLPLAVEAAGQIARRRLTMELLFLVGIASAMTISVWSMFSGAGPIYFEVVNVLLVVYSVGHIITARSRTQALAATQTMLSEVASARLVDGELIDATLVSPGQKVRVMPGELIPVDGIVAEGKSLVRATAFTGEWQTSGKHAGDNVLAGSACEDGTLVVEATAPGTDRRIDQLAALIASACSASSPLQRMADRFVELFLPAVTAICLATLLYWGLRESWTTGLFNALAVILVACPCAAGLAVPLATWTAISRLAEKGLLLKSAESLQRLASVDAVIFDKTGTLSAERLQVEEVLTAPDPLQRRRTLAILAEVERHSEHPVARALRELPREASSTGCQVLAVRTLPATGIEADIVVDGRPALLRLARRNNAQSLTIDATLDGIWIATASFSERFRESSSEAIAMLNGMGLSTQIMTGDSSHAGAAAAHLSPVTSGMTPEAKHSAAHGSSARTLFVGDGLNDAAAMAASHSSIAMASGAAITLEAADATLHGNDLRVIPQAIALCRRAVGTIRSNFAWAVAYNAVGMTLAAAGILHPVLAAILMSVSSAIVAWRSFGLRGSARATTLPTAAAASETSAAGWSLPSWLYASAHIVGMVGQGLVLILLAQLGVLGIAVTLISCLAVAALIIRYSRAFPAWLDMTIAMLTLGGLGMNLGWWIDLNFSPAMLNGSVAACCIARKTVEATTLEASSHWMYWLMLIVGVPAMYLLRRGPIRFNPRDWCCTGMLILGVPGMCFGMWAGAQLSLGLTEYSGQTQVIAAYILMILGMCAGMLVPHALSLTWQRPR